MDKKANDLKKRLLESDLGKRANYSESYDSSQLFSVARDYTRDTFSYKDFFGYDVWNCYELSWLNENNVPQAAIMQIIVPSNSKNIVESKSLKLYLNSFNNIIFKNFDEIEKLVAKDLSELLVADVSVKIYEIDEYPYFTRNSFEICIDKEDVKIENLSEPDSDLLEFLPEEAEEILYSNALRSICPITNQPDFATVTIDYEGNKICRKSLLKYIASFRKHGGFHEKCVEKIHHDITRMCEPKRLLVYANYTRRGGIDICPYRADYSFTLDYKRAIRQ
jgi:7-cyano-7-deazaguanine reductase